MRQNIVILGSTGSIGRNTLDVISRFPNKFRLVGISANKDVNTLKKQIDRFKPKYVAVYNKEGAALLSRYARKTKVISGYEGICKLASLKEVDTVVNAITGSAALLPLLSAIESGKKIAQANKEAIVVAGHIINRALENNPKAKIVPIDSEQNALFQCLLGYEKKMINTLYLTASGGPLKDFTEKQLKDVTPRQALSHPRWKMGKKISIDSATLMNKGLEVIEARWLFNIPVENIKVVIHKESIVHSLVEFIDGSILGQLSVTDMRLPIQYALSFPQRWYTNGSMRLDFFKLKKLSFEKPNSRKFPCLQLAYDAISKNNMLPCVLNAANEEAVNAFLEHKISFNRIPCVIEKMLKKHHNLKDTYRLKDVLRIDAQTRIQSQELIQKLSA